MEKNKKMMIVIIVLLVVLIGVTVGVAFFAYNTINSDTPTETVITSGSEVAFMQTELMKITDPMNCNLIKGPDGKEHAVSVTLAIGIDVSNKKDDEFIAKIKGSESIIKDAVNSVLTDKTYDEVLGTIAQDQLKEEILLRLQNEFKTNIIYRVYFDSFYAV